MAIPEQVYVDIDLHQNQLLNLSLHRVSIFPNKPIKSQVCYLTANIGSYLGNVPYYYNGFDWVQFGGGSSSLTINTSGDVSSVSTITPGNISLSQTVTGIQGKPITLATGYLKYNGSAWVFDTSSGGTVTSVGLTAPAIFTVTGSPVTTSGTLSFAWNGLSTNFVLADGSVVPRSDYLTVILASTTYQPLATNLTTFAGLGNPSSNGYVLSSTTAGVMSWIPVVGGGGTVTSVGLSAPSIFTVSGSPIATNGTLSFAWNGLSSQLVRGDGSTIPTNTYQNANTNLTSLSNLINPGSTAHLQITSGGVMSWDTTTYLSVAPTITLTGDVTGSGNGSFATSVVRVNGASVPASATLVGTNSSSQLISLSTVPLSAEPARTGDVTNSAGSRTLTISAGAVTLAKMANIPTSTILGNNSGSPAAPIALTTAQVKTLLALTYSDISGISATSPITYISGVIAHLATDGNLHVPATSTNNNGKVLTAGATAGSLSWTTPTTGTVTGTGSAGTVPKWVSASGLTNSSITDSGLLVTISNPLTATGAITFSTFTSAGFVKTNASGVLSVDTSTYLNSNILSAFQEPTGFENLTTSTISFVNATRTFTISPTITNFNVWVIGTRYVKTAESVVISNVVGIHYIYYNQSGVLTDSTTLWDFSNNASVALIYWDGTNALNLCEERHMTVMDWATHKYLHTTRGTQYVNGFGATYTLNNDTSIGIGLAAGQIDDEDIPLSITNGAINGYLTQPISGTAGSFPVYYRVGADGTNGTWRKDVATTLPYKNNGGTARPNYNMLSGGTWQQSIIPATYYVAYFIFATNNILEPIISVQGQKSSANLSDAQNSNNPNSLAYADFPMAEAKLLYRIILQTNPSYSGNIFLSQIVEVFDYRNLVISTSITTGGTGTVTSVGLLAPSIFTVTGSPITNAGVLSFAFNGVSTNFLLADGSTVARSAYQPSSANLTTVAGYSSLANLTSLVGLANPGSTSHLQITSGGVMSWDTATFIPYSGTLGISNVGANGVSATGYVAQYGYLISDTRGLNWRGGLVSNNSYWGLGQDAGLDTSFKPFVIGCGTTSSVWFKIDPLAVVKTTITGGLTLANMASGVVISTSGILSSISSAVGDVLISGGSGSVPTWGKVGLTTHVSGILPIANGGTNLSSLGTSNQILGVNSGATALEYKTFTQGSGIVITHSAGSVSFAVDSSILSTQFVGTWIVGAALGTSGATATTATSIVGLGYYIYQIDHNLNTLFPNVLLTDTTTGEPLFCDWFTSTVTTFNQATPTYVANNSLVIKLSTSGLTSILSKTIKITVTA